MISIRRNREMISLSAAIVQGGRQILPLKPGKSFPNAAKPARSGGGSSTSADKVSHPQHKIDG
jgi:hypothetical protein